MLNQSRPANHLLAALPAADYQRIADYLAPCDLRSRHTLHKRGEPLRYIYFPGPSLCSLVVAMADGAAAEIAVVGAEGLIGVEAVLGFTLTNCDATVQVAGHGIAQVMDIDAFRRELNHRGVLFSLVTAYTQAFVGFITQSVGCNGLHSADARCCRWLLHAQDRLGGPNVPLTHELISTMLGVRRPTVTLIVSELVQLGLITTSRGMIQIVNRPALEARSCECYHTVRALFHHLLPFEVSTQSPNGGKSWLEPVALTT
jgi:CRP-like cAMP-binding protein